MGFLGLGLWVWGAMKDAAIRMVIGNDHASQDIGTTDHGDRNMTGGNHPQIRRSLKPQTSKLSASGSDQGPSVRRDRISVSETQQLSIRNLRGISTVSEFRVYFGLTVLSCSGCLRAERSSRIWGF